MTESFVDRLKLRDLADSLWQAINQGRIFGRAAELAYYFLLALFPMLIFLTSLVGFLPGVQEMIFKSLARVVPGEAMSLIHQTIIDVTHNRSRGLISFGVLGALWAASGGVTAMMDTLNVVYEVPEERAFWKTRLLAIVLTILLSFLILGGTVLIMFGDRFSVWLATQLGLGAGFAVFWSVVDYLLGLALLLLGLQLLYYFGPNIEQKWQWITPGAIFAVLSLIAASLLFSLYLRVVPEYSATYGSLGAVVILLLWLYLVGIVVLVGAEINAIRARARGKPLRPKETATQLPQAEARTQ